MEKINIKLIYKKVNNSATTLPTKYYKNYYKHLKILRATVFEPGDSSAAGILFTAINYRVIFF
jgi:hypothetical protein